MLSRWMRTWQLGFRSLLLHPLRSLLTVLGIFVGVSSVIWLLAIGEGISRKAQEQIAALGAENIIIRTKKPPDDQIQRQGQGQGGIGLVYGLRYVDAERLGNSIPTIDEIIPIREFPQQFTYKTRTLEGRLVGCTSEYAEVTHLDVARGRFLAPSDNNSAATVCVLAHEVAEKLFAYEDPLGKEIRILSAVSVQYLTVVGVVAPRGQTAGVGGSLAAEDFTKDVYMPIDTLRLRVGDFMMQGGGGTLNVEVVELNQITLRIDDVNHVVDTADLVRRNLSNHHKWDDYTIVIPLDLLEQAKLTKMLFMLFMSLMAAISLVVGGIGIMNIMLATVTERTREIGIRRALGAKRGDITRQFLVETIVLSAGGGLTGVLGGLLCRPVLNGIRNLVQELRPDLIASLPEEMQALEPVLVPWSIPLAFGIAVGIGVLFGLYPAWRAATMDPVEALRHE